MRVSQQTYVSLCTEFARSALETAKRMTQNDSEFTRRYAALAVRSVLEDEGNQRVNALLKLAKDGLSDSQLQSVMKYAGARAAHTILSWRLR